MKNRDKTRQLLEQLLHSLAQPAEIRIAEIILEKFHTVMVYDIQKVIDGLNELPNACGDPKCVNCKASVTLLNEMLQFIHDKTAPIKEEYVKLFQDIDKRSQTIAEFMEKTHGQNRPSN